MAGIEFRGLHSHRNLHLRDGIHRQFCFFLKSAGESFCQNNVRGVNGVWQKEGIPSDFALTFLFLASDQDNILDISLILAGNKTFIQANGKFFDLHGNRLGHPSSDCEEILLFLGFPDVFLVTDFLPHKKDIKNPFLGFVLFS
jgi:hypothetical protein